MAGRPGLSESGSGVINLRVGAKDVSGVASGMTTLRGGVGSYSVGISELIWGTYGSVPPSDMTKGWGWGEGGGGARFFSWDVYFNTAICL